LETTKASCVIDVLRGIRILGCIGIILEREPIISDDGEVPLFREKRPQVLVDESLILLQLAIPFPQPASIGEEYDWGFLLNFCRIVNVQLEIQSRLRDES
jgi:hypothetical protein